MGEMQIIEIRGQRVLTTKQLAEAYETEQANIKMNFKRNMAKFTQGKHYIALYGNELRQFKNKVTNCYLVEKKAKCLYLWTEKGALFIAKSINTDRAWEVYEYLVDFYFRAKEQPRQQAPAVKEAPKPVPAPREKEKMVMDVPVNRKIQEKLAEARKYAGAIDVLLTEYDCYNEQHDFEAIRRTLFLLSGELARVTIRLMQTEPNQIKKE